MEQEESCAAGWFLDHLELMEAEISVAAVVAAAAAAY